MSIHQDTMGATCRSDSLRGTGLIIPEGEGVLKRLGNWAKFVEHMQKSDD